MKYVPWIALAYLSAGVCVAGWGVYLGWNGRPHFYGIGEKVTPVENYFETVLFWPLAMYMNVIANKSLTKEPIVLDKPTDSETPSGIRIQKK